VRHFWYFSHFKPYIKKYSTVGQIPCENRCGKLEDVNIFDFFLRVQAGAAPAPTGKTVQGYTDVFEFSAAMFAGKLAVPKCWLFVAFNPLSFERSNTNIYTCIFLQVHKFYILYRYIYTYM
jgi:hypothetical protein